jgi:uncharacterized protein involved in exopolysaccharide biosynthesis
MQINRKMTSDTNNNNETLPPKKAPELFLEFKSWFFYLLKKWWIILLVVTFATSLGILYAWIKKPQYQSSLTFALEENGGGGISGALSLAAEFGLNLGGSRSIFSGENILQIINSRRVVEKVLLSIDSLDKNNPRTIAQYLLDLNKDEKKKSKKSLDRLLSVSFPPGKMRSDFTYLEDSILFVLYKDEILPNLIAHRPDKKLGIFEIQFTSPDERFTKIFTERILKETSDFYTELRSKKSRQTMEILERRVAALRGNVSSAIIGRSDIQDANLNPAFAAAQAQVQVKQADLSAYGGAYAELFKNLELARYQFLQDMPLLQVIDAADYPMKKIKHGRLFMGIVFGMVAGILVLLSLTGVYLSNGRT